MLIMRYLVFSVPETKLPLLRLLASNEHNPAKKKDYVLFLEKQVFEDLEEGIHRSCVI